MRNKICLLWLSFLMSTLIFAQPCTTPSLRTANNQFAFDIYKGLLKGSSPVFFSPYSIYTALHMTGEGANGITATEMQQTLHSTGLVNCIRQDIQYSLKQFKLLEQMGDSIRTANALWLQEGFPVNPEFSSLVADSYQAGLHMTNFSNNPEVGRQAINTWTAEQTNNRIKELLVKGVVTTGTRLVLVNTIWFKGKWADPFKKENTAEKMFYAEMDSVKVPFMNNTSVVKYAENELAQLIELPYRSNKLSMVIVLPVKGREVDFEKSFNEEKLRGWMDSMQSEKTSIHLPKFKMECTFQLGDMLQSLGMHSAFLSLQIFPESARRRLKSVP
ncbi:MAG: serpin family protein [Chitinophagaceae bacterium]|nr:serpin family protein [Chitinophagaceae bacterium]